VTRQVSYSYEERHPHPQLHSETVTSTIPEKFNMAVEFVTNRGLACCM